MQTTESFRRKSYDLDHDTLDNYHSQSCEK